MRALLYANTDGIANFYHGSGVQTRVLLDVWKDVTDSLAEIGGDEWRLHVAVHDWEIPLSDYRVDPVVLKDSLDKARANDVRVHQLVHDSNTDLWSFPKWSELSLSVANLLSRLADEYDEILFIGVDVPYSLVREYCEHSLPRHKLDKITFALSFHTSALVEEQTWIPGREALEREYVRKANDDASTFITTLTPFFDKKLEADYGVTDDAWMRLGHGIAPHSDDMTPLSLERSEKIVASFDIPRGMPILVHFGRDHPMKRIPFAIDAVSRIDRPFHFVLIASTPANTEEAWKAPHDLQLRRLLKSYSYFSHFDRDLPRALAQLPETAAFLLSAKGEPMGQIPQEIACWAGGSAPVVVAPEDGGYGDQVKEADSGFTFDVHSVSSFTHAIERAMGATLDVRKVIAGRMREHVDRSFDAARNFSQLLMSVEFGEYGIQHRAGVEAK